MTAAPPQKSFSCRKEWACAGWCQNDITLLPAGDDSPVERLPALANRGRRPRGVHELTKILAEGPGRAERLRQRSCP